MVVFQVFNFQGVLFCFARSVFTLFDVTGITNSLAGIKPSDFSPQLAFITKSLPMFHYKKDWCLAKVATHITLLLLLQYYYYYVANFSILKILKGVFLDQCMPAAAGESEMNPRSVLTLSPLEGSSFSLLLCVERMTSSRRYGLMLGRRPCCVVSSWAAPRWRVLGVDLDKPMVVLEEGHQSRLFSS